MERFSSYSGLSSGYTILSGTKHNRSCSLAAITSATTCSFQISLPAKTTYYICFGFHLYTLTPTSTNSGSNLFVLYANNSTSYPQITVKLNSNFQLEWGVGNYTQVAILNNGALLMPYSWHRVVIKVVISNTVGVFELYLNGKLVDTFTNINTDPQGANEASLITFFTPYNSLYYDDIVIYNGDGNAAFNSYLPTIHPVIRGFQPGTLPAPNNWTGDATKVNKDTISDGTYLTTSTNSVNQYATPSNVNESLTDFFARDSAKKVYGAIHYARMYNANWTKFSFGEKLIGSGQEKVQQLSQLKGSTYNNTVVYMEEAPDNGAWTVAKAIDTQFSVGRD
jgi:hypothetical protein